jgi:hypothetical protein
MCPARCAQIADPRPHLPTSPAARLARSPRLRLLRRCAIFPERLGPAPSSDVSIADPVRISRLSSRTPVLVTRTARIRSRLSRSVNSP